MATRTIATRLTLEGEKEYKKELGEVNQEIGLLSDKMKRADAEFRGQANSIEALTTKNDLLREAQQKQIDKIAKLQTAIEDCGEAYGENDEAVMRFKRQLEKAETDLINLNDELSSNERYLDEARTSADKCAKSIDEYGKQVKEAAEATDDLNGAGGGKGGIGDLIGQLGSLKKMLVGGAAAVAVKEVAGAILDVAKAGAAYADDVLTMSTVTGISTQALQEYRYMADLVDVSVETITGSLTKLTRNMLQAKDGTGEQAEAFAALGIEITNADGSLRDSQTVWDEVITALGQMTNETERDAYAMVLMGKSAQDLNPLIEAGAESIDGFRQEAHDTGYVLDEEMLSTLGELQDSFDRLQTKSDACKNKLATTFAPAIISIADEIADAWGKVTDAVIKAYEWMTKPLPINDKPKKEIPSDYQALLDSYKIDGSHAEGLYRVPYDGYVAELHRGERVLTSGEADAYNALERYGGAGRAMTAQDFRASLAQAVNAMAAMDRDMRVTVVSTMNVDGREFYRATLEDLRAVSRADPEVGGTA